MIVIVLSLSIAGSEDVNSSNNNLPITETQAVQKAKQVNSGTVTKTEHTTYN